MQHTTQRIKIWDIPTRLFHWSLVGLIGVCYYTMKVEPNMIWHKRAGIAIFMLVLFRIVWGFIGTRHARFTDFVRGPVAVLDYFKGKPSPTHGHNPAGAGMVLLLLMVLLWQSGSGLFTNSEDFFFNAPLYKWVGLSLSNSITSWHQKIADYIPLLILIHVSTVFFYLLIKKNNLIKPMVTGYKVSNSAASTTPWRERLLLASITFVVIAVGIYGWIGF